MNERYEKVRVSTHADFTTVSRRFRCLFFQVFYESPAAWPRRCVDLLEYGEGYVEICASESKGPFLDDLLCISEIDARAFGLKVGSKRPLPLLGGHIGFLRNNGLTNTIDDPGKLEELLMDTRRHYKSVAVARPVDDDLEVQKSPPPPDPKPPSS